MEQQFRITDIEVNQAAQDEHIVGLFRYESESKGKKSPLLVILVEIASTLYVYEQLLDVINETADQTRHMIAGVDGDPMARFEKLVERLNAAIEDFADREPSEIAWRRVNMFVMEFSENSMCVTGIGRLANIFLQKQADGSFKTFDLYGSLEQPVDVDPKKVFSSLLCGELKPGDLMFAGTNNFDHWRGDLNMIERLKELPPVSAVMEIRQDIERVGIPEDFAGVIVNHVRAAAPAKPPSIHEREAEKKQPKSTESVQKLYTQERQTQAMLSPSLGPSAAPKEREKQREPSFSFVKLFAELRTKVKDLRSNMKDPMSMTSLRGMNAGHGSFFSASKKRTLIIGVVALLVLAGTGGWMYFGQKVKAEQELWNAVYDQAVDRKNRAEADLVYGNEDRTRRLIREAQELVGGLDEKTEERRNSKQQIAQELQGILDKLRREQRVDAPELLASLAADVPSGSLAGLALADGKLYAADNAAKQILEIDPSTKQVARHDFPSNVTGSVVSASEGTNGAVFLTDDEKAFRISGSTVTSYAYPSETAQSVKDLDVYNNRFYVLDPSSNMIWRHSVTGNAVGAGEQYLKQNSASLSTAVGMAIDASIYVAFSDGSVKRYLSGTEESWSPAAIDPALANIHSVWTDPDTDRVAVTDTNGKRIVIFRKDGRLVAQIVSSEFQSPRFVIGDSANKKLYVIDGNRVFRFDLP